MSHITTGGPRRQRALRALSVASLVALLVAGCSTNPSGPSDEDIQAAQTLANEGFALLAAALNSDGDLTAAGAKFEAALELDPNNADANVGLTIVEFVQLSEDPAITGLFADFFPASPFAKALPERGVGFARVLGGPASGAGAGILSVKGVLDATHGHLLKIAQTGPLPGQIQDVAEQVVLPVLTLITQLLDVVENQPAWSITLTAQMTGNEQVEIDVTDIYFLDTIVRALKAQIHALVAYDVDLPLTGGEGDLAVFEQYLDQDTGTFLTLRENGAQNLGLALSTIGEAAQRALLFVASIQNETDNQNDDLIKIDTNPLDEDSQGPTVVELAAIQANVQALNAALTGTQNVNEDFNGDGQEQVLTVNLGAFFNSPIQDFKKKIPPYFWDSEYMFFFWDGFMEQDFSQFLFPDPDFNGIFPGMTSDAMFKSFFGIEDFPSPGPFGMGPGGE